MSSSTATINDLEAKINALERENFDLKLRLHYLQNKLGSKGFPLSPTSAALDGEENSNNGAGDSNNHGINNFMRQEMITLREENEYSKKRIIELEAEVLQLQLGREREAEQYQKALKVRPTTAVYMEDQRKREREVAMTIAEHDATMIQKLQEEVGTLQGHRVADQQRIETLTKQVAQTSKSLEAKEKEVLDLKEKLAVNNHFGNNNGYNGNGFDMIPANNNALLSANAGNNARNSGTAPMVITANTGGQQTSIMINSQSFVASTTANNRPNPNTITFSTGPSGGTNANGFGNPDGSTPSYNRTFEASQGYTLVQENKLLRERLEQLQESIQKQETIIASMKQSSNEISLIESEEIRRMEVELAKAVEERDLIKGKFNKMESDNERMMTDLLEARRELLRQKADFADAMSNINKRGGGSGGLGSALDNSYYGNSSTPFKGSLAGSQMLGSPAIYEKTIEMYK